MLSRAAQSAPYVLELLTPALDAAAPTVITGAFEHEQNSGNQAPLDAPTSLLSSVPLPASLENHAITQQTSIAGTRLSLVISKQQTIRLRELVEGNRAAYLHRGYQRRLRLGRPSS